MKCPMAEKQLSNLIKSEIISLKEIRGGISKLVYRITSVSGEYILYIWQKPYGGSLTENKINGVDYLFSEGIDYLLCNTKLLSEARVRVPEIVCYGKDPIKGFDYAVVEALNGQSFDEFMKMGGDLSAYSEKLLRLMQNLASVKRSYFGSPLKTEPFGQNATKLIYDFYSEELRIASELDNEVFEIRNDIQSLMKCKLEKINNSDNDIYSLIHGELTPQHIFIMEDGEIALIDIEAVKYFDEEYDWAVIDYMYGGKIFLPDRLDRAKLDFYSVCLIVGYLSVSVDYIKNIDAGNLFYKYIRNSNLSELKKRI